MCPVCIVQKQTVVVEVVEVVVVEEEVEGMKLVVVLVGWLY